jgi:hypothetical protein
MRDAAALVMDTVRSALAILFVGDGVVAAIVPARHARRWRFGPRWSRRWMDWYAARPGVTRVLGLAEAAIGVWLATSTER